MSLRGAAARPKIRVYLAVIPIALVLGLPVSALAGTSMANSSSARERQSGVESPPLEVAVPDNASYNWPELHDNPQLLGYAANSPIATTNATDLGVGWDTDLYGSALDSPAVAYDPALGVTLAYIGTEAGDFLGVNVQNGQILWSDWLGSIIRSSPLVYNGSVYVGTFTNPAVLRLNASTGAKQARVISPDPIEGTPTVATPPGGVPTIYMPTLDTGDTSAPLLALNAATLAVEWKFDDYHKEAGSWASASYGVDAEGLPLVLFGTDNPDSSIYAVDALNGSLVWRFQCLNPDNGDWDVASGPVISLPGVNGFAQGVVYAINKYSYTYALDLNNGTLLWETDFRKLANLSLDAGVSRSTAALDGTNLVFGYEQGLIDLNAITGKEIWIYRDPTLTESIASPAITGGGGNSVVVTGDVGGDLDVVSLAKGTALYTYPTGGYITASPAVVGGNIVIASSNGFLYDFVVGGGNPAALPTTAITSPTQGSDLTNPNGDLGVAGSASDSGGVGSVIVAVQEDGAGGPWWDATTGTWSSGPVGNAATLTAPGASSTAWSFRFPVPKSGATYALYANAVASSGPTDLVGDQVDFSVAYDTVGPHLEVSPSFVAPGGSATVTGGGFAHSEKITLTVDGAKVGAVTSNATGAFAPTTIEIATNATFGFTSIAATGKNASQSSSAPLAITNSWDQAGAGPGQSGYEPNDEILNNLVYPGNNTWVKLAWYFASGAAFNASPAIVDGVAYLADTTGEVFAVATDNGGLLWTYTLASGAAIEGSPAVDASLGLVFVGANDGTVYAISISNGTLAWSTDLGGELAAPVFADGRLYVTSSTGTVASLEETTGKVAWSKSLSSSIAAAPSLDPTSDLLVVTDLGGDVIALNASSGATRWTFATDGAVHDPAVLAEGEVFVGSDDEHEYALTETGGSLLWSYDAGAAIETAATIDPDHSVRPFAVAFGTVTGRVDELRGSTGLLRFQVDPGSGHAIVGIASVAGVLFFEISTGEVGSVRAYPSTNAIFWHRLTGADLASAPAIVDGTVYVTGEDGDLYAWDTNGQPPL